ncbi:hypothetical protein CBR_g939 [Chara braunii]|uniref:Protein transport protein SEC23 n=1 Tax=Chara braunii TaxID=69332 RepID=A0A388KCN1_CHABU|nr:hypothetical protein CBR_g939 [Chara braunii]|eukprot:GBG67818.1 hypothetical protein CBR_g939 [Chara braunii]
MTTPMLPSKASPSSASSGFLDPYYDMSSNSQASTAPFSATAAATALNGPSSLPSALRPAFSSPLVSSAASSSPPFVAGAGAPPFAFSSSSSLPSGTMSSSFDLSSFKGEPGGGDGLADNLRAMSLTGQGQNRYSPLPMMMGMGMPPRSAVPPSSYLPPASAPSFGRPAAAAASSMAYALGGGSSVSPSLFVPSPPDPMMTGAAMPTMSSRSLGAMQSMGGVSPPPSAQSPSSNGFFAPVPVSTVGSVTDRDLNEEDPASAGAPFVYFSAQKIPTQKKIANIGSLPFGALISPVKEVDAARPPVLTRNPVRCEMCGAHVNLYCKVAPRIGQWTCVFCTHTNSSSGNYSVDDFGSWPELVVKTVDYVISNPRSGYSVASGVAPAPAPSAILLIDENLSDPYMQELQKSLFGVMEKMPEDTRVGIITYGAAVSVYDLSEPGIASADVLPGSSSPTEEAIKILLYGSGSFLSPIHSCAPIAHSIVSSLRPYRGKAVESERKRCLGAAVEVALALIRGPMGEEESIRNRGDMGLSRILVCTSGPPNYGPGAAPVNEEHPNFAYEEANAKAYLETLGKEAKYLDVAVDIFCAGACPVKVPVLHPLAKASGGLLWLHDDFGETFGGNLQRAVSRVCGTEGVLEVRCSGPVAITRIIGPAEAITDSQEESFPEDIVTSCGMSSVEENQGFVLCMELRDDVSQDHVHFQFVARYVNLERARVVRVITLRLPTTGSASTYLNAVVEDVAAVLIAKRTVVEALTPEDAADMKLSIDERLKDIALHFGTQMKGSKMRKFPSELHRLPEMLFHLRRGALLGSIVGHEDERAVLRNVFLQASFDLSLRMTVPRLLAHVQGGTFEEVPAVNLALQSEVSLVLDHGTDVFIWMGLDVLADEAKSAGALAACKTLALEAVENRFPLPRIVVCKEADSKARYLLARLVPAHKDSPFEQDAWFPKLRTLQPEQRAKLKTKFFHTDDPSFFEYLKSLKLMPPEVPSGFR